MCVFALATSVLILLLPGAVAVPEAGRSSLQLVSSQLSRADVDVLIVNLLDGRVVALDHGSGQILWTFDSGAPLVSAKQTTALSQGMNVFPGTDGGLYAYRGMKQLQPGLERLAISLPDLVDAAPSLTADGSIILGRRESKVFLLDKLTGRSVSTISNAADALEDHSGALGLSLGFSRSDLVVLARQDYVVRSVRVDSKAETWNATFSRMFLMSGNAGSVKDFLQHGAPPVLQGAARPAGLPRLVVGADNSLQAFDSRTLHRKWYVAFDTPPVSAYRQDGSGGNFLDPDQAVTGPALRPATGIIHISGKPVAGKLRGQLPGGTAVLVGALRGSLYALPADHLMLADGATGPGGSGAVVWPDRVGRLPMDINPADTAGMCNAAQDAAGVQSGHSPPQVLPVSQALHVVERLAPDSACDAGAPPTASAAGNSCSSSSIVTLVDDSDAGSGAGHALVPLEPSDSEVLLDELGSLTCPQPPLGIHALSRQQAPAVTWLPEPTLPPAHKTSHSWQLPSWISFRVVAASILALLLLPVLLRSRAYSSSRRNTALAPTQLQPHVQGTMIKAAVSPSSASKEDAKQKKVAAAMAADVFADSATNGEDTAMEGVQVASVTSHSLNGLQLQQHHDQQQQPNQPGPLSNGALSPAFSAADLLVANGSPSSLVDPGLLSPGGLSPVPASGGSAGVSEAGSGVGQPISRSYLDEDGAVVIGRLRVGPGILGYGSGGTVVYEGVLDSRPVAVKRLLRQFYNLARKEIQVLVVSDEHPNVVRCFAMEEDREFVYLALERCKTSLSDTMATRQGRAFLQNYLSGSPTPWCLSVLSDIAAGLAALHARQIVHRDLKPHNVLLTEAGRAKLSDMGLSKQLVSEQSSFESHGSGGSSGWQAPEQLIAKDGGAVRQSRAVDVFSLGCIMYYCLTGGKHPFGEQYERDTNIMRGLPNLNGLMSQPEAHNLVTAMLSKSPSARPSMSAVLGHPFWWTDEQRLQFLVDVSDRVEFEDREPDPTLLNAFESYSSAAVGSNWGAGLDAELVANLGKYRRYDYSCLRDLLRVVRNKRNHFREMPDSLQRMLGPVPDGYYRYFSSRFPMLLLGVFFFALKHLYEDPNLTKYWAVGQPGFATFHKPWQQVTAAAAAGPRSSRTSKGASARRNSAGSLSRTAPAPLPPVASVTSSRSLSGGGANHGTSSSKAAAVAVAPAGGAAATAQPSVISFAEVVIAGTAATSAGAGAAVSAAVTNGPATAAATAAAGTCVVLDPDGPPVVGYTVADGEEELHTPSFPARPGKQTCDFYLKTGHCKYGPECVFDHPPEYAVQLTEQGLPFRAGQPICTFYQKTQQCKFGPSCKFHHPKLIPIYAGSAIPADRSQPLLPWQQRPITVGLG